ncbi:hypothetical protein yrohd0001_25870 [Yersinia rohdei ATCC 43380]|nr:hypothetical protein yrohd0001_25870 [Yersinia rohdei ATCC 43380]
MTENKIGKSNIDCFREVDQPMSFCFLTLSAERVRIKLSDTSWKSV